VARILTRKRTAPCVGKRLVRGVAAEAEILLPEAPRREAREHVARENLRRPDRHDFDLASPRPADGLLDSAQLVPTEVQLIEPLEAPVHVLGFAQIAVEPLVDEDVGKIPQEVHTAVTRGQGQALGRARNDDHRCDVVSQRILHGSVVHDPAVDTRPVFGPQVGRRKSDWKCGRSGGRAKNTRQPFAVFEIAFVEREHELVGRCRLRSDVGLDASKAGNDELHLHGPGVGARGNVRVEQSNELGAVRYAFEPEDIAEIHVEDAAQSCRRLPKTGKLRGRAWDVTGAYAPGKHGGIQSPGARSDDAYDFDVTLRQDFERPGFEGPSRHRSRQDDRYFLPHERRDYARATRISSHSLLTQDRSSDSRALTSADELMHGRYGWPDRRLREKDRSMLRPSRWKSSIGRIVAGLPCIALAGCASLATKAERRGGDAVTQWTLIGDYYGNAAANWRTLAVMQMAMHDALNAAHPVYMRWWPAAAGEPAADKANPEVAMAAAADEVLALLHPDRDAETAAAFATILARYPDDAGKAAGINLGKAIGRAAVERRSGDGYDEVRFFHGNDLPGRWRPTPTLFATSPTNAIRPFLFTAVTDVPALPPTCAWLARVCQRARRDSKPWRAPQHRAHGR
jgi:hypothetical protein